MKAVEANLLQFLNVKQQFQIPLYQRAYSWDLVQCKQLWQDIVRVARDDSTPTHFVGSIVFIKHRAGAETVTGTPRRLVIDGQQRLSTLMLLLSALRSALASAEARGQSCGVLADEIQDEALFNRHGKGDDRYKLLLTDKDRATLIRIVDGLPLGEADSPRLVQNHAFFAGQIASGEVDFDTLYRGLKKLTIVEVALEWGVDNPQLIFESLNSTGLKLSQTDLIRNFVLMGLEKSRQDSLYMGHWQPMEQAFVHHESGQPVDYYPAWFDSFVRDYLTLKKGSGAIPKISAVYQEFKHYASRTDTGSIEEVVADLHHYARHYVRLALWGREADAEIHGILRDISALDVDVAYPFLLRALDDYDAGRLQRADFIAILRLVESYVFRRSVCGIPTNSLNKTFAALHRRVRPGKYLESVQSALLLADSYRRFPRDDEFTRELKIKDVYHTRTVNYLLRKLENHERPEKIHLPDPHVTVEHILPQTPNLRAEWQRDLGDQWQALQSTLVHTLGNLTLTGYNSSFSDRPFLEKRDLAIDGEQVGLGHSPFRLNNGLENLEAWNATRIEERAARLATRAATVWSCPSLSEDVLASYGALPTESEEAE